VLGFVSQKLEPFDGAHMNAGDLFRLWVGDCTEMDVTPGSQKAFAGRVRRYYQQDPNGGRPRYLNVRLKSSQPSLRVVVNNQ
jgi:hypothetical protein